MYKLQLFCCRQRNYCYFLSHFKRCRNIQIVIYNQNSLPKWPFLLFRDRVILNICTFEKIYESSNLSFREHPTFSLNSLLNSMLTLPNHSPPSPFRHFSLPSFCNSCPLFGKFIRSFSTIMCPLELTLPACTYKALFSFQVFCML